MYNEATDVGGGGRGGADTRDFRLYSTSICQNRFWIAISLPPPSSFFLLLSLTRCNFVVSSVPAGCDNPLLLIILNQEGLSLSLSVSFADPPPTPFSLQETDKMEKNETCA